MSPTDHVRQMFAAFDSKDVSALAAFMTDDVRLRLGSAEPVQGESAFVEAVNAFLASVAGFRHEVLNVWSDGAMRTNRGALRRPSSPTAHPRTRRRRRRACGKQTNP